MTDDESPGSFGYLVVSWVVITGLFVAIVYFTSLQAADSPGLDPTAPGAQIDWGVLAGLVVIASLVGGVVAYHGDRRNRSSVAWFWFVYPASLIQFHLLALVLYVAADAAAAGDGDRPSRVDPVFPGETDEEPEAVEPTLDSSRADPGEDTGRVECGMDDGGDGFDHTVHEERARGWYVEVTHSDGTAGFFVDDGEVEPESSAVTRRHGEEWVQEATAYLRSAERID